MRIAFFGSDVFAAPSLRALAAAGHEIVVTITNPARPRGRSGAPQPTPIKELAGELGSPMFQPAGRPLEEGASRIAAAGAELGVVVAYGQFLGRSVRKAPSLGYCINLHASLLPRWRGAAPVAAAIKAGDSVTGITIQRVARRMDAGPILLAREEPIDSNATRGALRDRLSEMGAEALVEAVAAIKAGEAVFTPQDEERATHAPLLTKSDGALDLTRPADELDRVVRAFHPWPGAFLPLAKGKLQVLRAVPVPGNAPPGTVLGGGELTIATGAGALDLLEVKPAGKKTMRGAAFANGRRLEPGGLLT